jgi:hypothetical protein
MEWTFGESVDDHITRRDGARCYQPPTSVTTTWDEYADFLHVCSLTECDPVEKAGDPDADPPIYGTTPYTAPFVLRQAQLAAGMTMSPISAPSSKSISAT